jgi:hypothetical protein
MCSVLTANNNDMSAATDKRISNSEAAVEAVVSEDEEIASDVSDEGKPVSLKDNLEDYNDEEEVSVGSPEAAEKAEMEAAVAADKKQAQSNSTTAALRVFRSSGGAAKRQRPQSHSEDEVEDEDEDDEDERPLDFTKQKSKDLQVESSYFLPFKRLEMSSSGGEKSPPNHHQHYIMNNEQESSDNNEQDNNTVNHGPPTSQNKKAIRGVAGFSIDDILSHKTAAMKEQKQAAQQQQNVPPQAIVRPWDITGGNGGGGHSAAVAAAAAAIAHQQRLKKAKGGQGSESSPLDALFQMASKTFEGLKAKSGRISISLILFCYLLLNLHCCLSIYWKTTRR